MFSFFNKIRFNCNGNSSICKFFVFQLIFHFNFSNKLNHFKAHFFIPAFFMWLRGPESLKNELIDFRGHPIEGDYEIHTKFLMDLIEKCKFM